MLLRKLFAFAVTSGLAKKAWNHVRHQPPPTPVDITDVVARPVGTADPAERQRRGLRRIGARRRRQGPGS